MRTAKPNRAASSIPTPAELFVFEEGEPPLPDTTQGQLFHVLNKLQGSEYDDKWDNAETWVRLLVAELPKEKRSYYGPIFKRARQLYNHVEFKTLMKEEDPDTIQVFVRFSPPKAEGKRK